MLALHLDRIADFIVASANVGALAQFADEVAHEMVRGGSLVRAGVPLSFHSDFTMAPAEPLRLAAVAASRITAEGNEVGADERVPVEAALRAVTIEAARLLRMEDEIGSIAVGKRADFTVLARDPWQTPIEELAGIPIVATVLDGVPQPIER